MPKKDRLKKTVTPPEPETAGSGSSRFQFFLWICSFFFFAALVMRLDVITVWPGAEGYALDLALSNERGQSLYAFVSGLLFGPGQAIDAQTEAIWLFPRLLSALAVLLTGFFTYRLAGRLFGPQAIGYGLLCAGASLFLPFFGKVATPDALALLGQVGFFWSVLLAGADAERNYLIQAGLFLFVAAVAAPLSTLAFGLGTIVAGRMLLGGGKQWMNLLFLLAIPVLILILQGNQGVRSYWFWGGQPLAYGRWLGYCLLGMLPLTGWLLGGLRDLVYKLQREELAARLMAAGLLLGFATQSLLFPLLLALLAGKQLQLYFREANYPWRDWVRGGAVVHVALASLGAFMALAGIGIAFPGAGYRAALGMVAAYWIFSLLGVIGLFGERRDFAIGGSVLAGLLGVLFFWVQVYPYFEAERGWAARLAEQVEVPLPTYVPADPMFSVALPYFRRAGIPTVQDTAAADLRLVSRSPTDSLLRAPIEVPGRILLERRLFGVIKE
ncbi:hypothetical protein QWY85_06680 [Neolewinella lacunae]|uniref:Uncharacterized protein n=1 Tax=Neolewinella lacunae TaxID=1517758 RepID=A0A923PG27_9BACT|nr:hypothetical protein [Neolewinella lacunae]MBC6992594.1 hypothetical protein [Neolewinella lacunae]MDN3634335.1 hypothetical protein [Neolewinella lacunae]